MFGGEASPVYMMMARMAFLLMRLRLRCFLLRRGAAGLLGVRAAVDGGRRVGTSRETTGRGTEREVWVIYRPLGLSEHFLILKGDILYHQV